LCLDTHLCSFEALFYWYVYLGHLWDVSDADQLMLRGLLEGAIAAPPPESLEVTGPLIQEAVEAVLKYRTPPDVAAAEAVGGLAE
jgi:hypothetical protein